MRHRANPSRRTTNAAVTVSVTEGAKSSQDGVPPDPISPFKISFQSVPICRSYSPKSDFVRIQYMYMPKVPCFERVTMVLIDVTVTLCNLSSV